MISQCYIPVDGWNPGVYSFQLVISSVNDTTERVLGTFDVEETITGRPVNQREYRFKLFYKSS